MNNQKRLPIMLQLTSMFAIAVILMLSVLGYSIYNYLSLSNESNNVVTHTAARTMSIKDAHTDYVRALLNLRGFLLYNSDASFEQSYRDDIKKAKELVKQFNTTSTMQDTKEEGTKLDKLLNDYCELAEKIIAAKKNNDPNINILTSEGRQ
ncbi:MAG: methyl-accepting chemotaxis sensory transducer, partial [Pelosinus sp.]|nr:methyl-accepting chemotaxis sensory transducer [Pelosinus sp.]